MCNRCKLPSEHSEGSCYALQIQQIGVDVFHNKGIRPEAGLDVDLRVSNGVFGRDGNLQIAAFSAHSDGGMDVICAVFHRDAEQLLVADVTVRLLIDVQAERARDAIGRALAVDINAALFLYAQRLFTIGARLVYGVDVARFAAMRAFDSDFCRHGDSSQAFLFLLYHKYTINSIRKFEAGGRHTGSGIKNAVIYCNKNGEMVCYRYPI